MLSINSLFALYLKGDSKQETRQGLKLDKDLENASRHHYIDKFGSF
jgi:hypothetical protein